jgi:hypothetical protein
MLGLSAVLVAAENIINYFTDDENEMIRMW